MPNTSSQQPKQHTEPGVFMSVLDHGVLLRGPSGIGKSELALALIRNGHKLISDDTVILSQSKNGILGASPKVTQNFLEIRGLGILDVKELFGEKALCAQKKLDLIIKLIKLKDTNSLEIDRVEGMYAQEQIIDTPVTEITLPVAPGRGLAVLVEVAIRNHILRNNGYNAADALKKRQKEFLDNQHEC